MNEIIGDSVVVGSFDDYEEAYSVYRDAAVRLGLTGEDAVARMNAVLREMRREVPIEIYVSSEVYDEMALIDFRPLTLQEVADDEDCLAGPPYYYFHIEYSSRMLALFHDAFSRVVR